jgi:hypothetical protein
VGSIRFTTTLQPRGPAAAVVLADDQVAEVGEGALAFPVVATINGYTWRGRVSRMRGEHLLGMSREVRQGAGVEAGDTVEVEVVLDTGSREVDVPAELAAALAADAAAAARFDALAYTHRKEFARWVGDAKKVETRARRVEQAIEMLHAGRTRS